MTIKVTVYDDNDAVRQSIETLLLEEKDIEFVAGFSNAETIETDIEQLKPDVILMDIDMPKISGVEAVKRIRKYDPALPVIMLTVFEDDENIFHAICAGATGYILKRFASQELAEGLRNVMNGGAPMTGAVARKVLQMLSHAHNEKKGRARLTQREQEILQYMVEGFSFKMIAAEIGISLDTVRFHIKNIYEKLHVNSATEAVSHTLRHRLL